MQLIESLQSRDRELMNIHRHNRRINAAREALFGCSSPIDLRELVLPPMPGIVKCRVVYDTAIREITYEPYTPRKPASLKLVYSNTVSYAYKYADRSALNALFEQRGECDDIIIVKERRLTDSFAGNTAFYDGRTWFTPSRPLLCGTRREALLDAGLLVEQDIRVEDLGNFEKVSLINCMIDLGELQIPTGSIIP